MEEYMAASRIQQAASSESEDSFKYEIDTKVLLEETYNNWLGRSKNDQGVWDDDPDKLPMMNKVLADKLIASIKLKVNTHSMISVYDKDFINKVAYKTAKEWNKSLRFNLENYNVSVEDYRVLILVDIPFLIKQLLLASLNGTMMKYRTEKGKIVVHRQDAPVNSEGL